LTHDQPTGIAMRNPIKRALLAYAGRLRFPTLFLVTLGLFVLDLVVPDPIPFVDEVLLGLGTLLFASWRRRRDPKP
jgi:hypothetical protein